MDSGTDGTQNTTSDVVEPSQSQMGVSPGPTGVDALNFITPVQDELPCIRYRPISSYEGMTISTPRVPLYPPLHQHQVFGTTKKENPAQSPQELLDLMYMDFANRSYVTYAAPPQPKEPQPEADPKGDQKTDPKIDPKADSQVDKQPQVDQQPQEEEENKTFFRILAASLTPKQGIDQPFKIKQPQDASQIESASSRDLVYGTGEEIDQSLSIHTAQFANASTQQMQSTFLQDLSMPPQTISCEKFLDWTNYISTWTVDERKEMEARTSVARFANLGYYRPEIDIEDDINQRIFVIQGDITAIECDAIVNVTDEQLNVESLVSQAILARGGIKLQKAMKKLSLSTGECRMTKGYRLPVKNVIHVAVPHTEEPTLMRSCMDSILTMAMDNEFRTLALPCFVSEGYPRPQAKPQYPLVPAVHVMMRTARKWLDQNWAKLTRLMFVASSYREFHVLCELMLDYFPVLPTKPPTPPVRIPTPEPTPEPPKKKKPKKKKKIW